TRCCWVADWCPSLPSAVPVAPYSGAPIRRPLPADRWTTCDWRPSSHCCCAPHYWWCLPAGCSIISPSLSISCWIRRNMRGRYYPCRSTRAEVDIERARKMVPASLAQPVVARGLATAGQRSVGRVAHHGCDTGLGDPFADACILARSPQVTPALGAGSLCI